MSGSVGDEAAQLRSVASSVPSGAVGTVHGELEQVRDGVYSVLGTAEAEAVLRAQHVADVAASLFRGLVALRATLHELADYHAGSGAAPPSASEPQREPHPPPSVTASDGSRYPAEAAGDVVNLPPRVQERNNQRTVGQATLGGRPVGGIRSGRDAWSAAVSQRLGTLSIQLPRILHAHAEMKLAAMMIDTGVRDGTVTMNNVPCGSQQGQPSGCHQVLDRFLPEGFTLTVRGTTEHGKPYTYTYRGKATS